jgi:MGT family glycosyltransferase
VATLRSLDPVQRGPAWHHVGPLAPAGPHRQAAVLPWSTDASEPLVLVSLSTLTAYGDQTPALQAILDALAATGLRVLVTTGPAVSAVKLRAPRNAAVFSFLPHAHVMPAVSACVTHAGHGTVTAALANGVPLVCRPNPAADQPYLARRIAELGAGLSVPTDAGPDHVRWAVERVLSEPSFRAEAHRLAAEAAAAPGVAGAAEILERLAGVGRSAGPGPYTAGAPEREP